MKLRKLYHLDNAVYTVNLITEDWSEADKNLMARYGEPEIDVGGDFTGPPAFELPSDLVRIMSDTPFTQAFDARDYANAADRANVWADEISDRINAALVTLRTEVDDFTREEVENI